ncbi:MAG: hypothetical protein PVG07_16760, partial [Acidobacteriota bacterium]
MARLRALVGTFLWLRWRMLAGALAAQRRGGWSLLSRWLEAAGTLFLWVSTLGGALAFSVVALLAAGALAGGGMGRAVTLIGVRVGFGMVLGGFLVFPALRGLRTGAGGRIRLQLLPIPNRLLHALEVGAGLADPVLLLVAPVPFVLGLALVPRAGLAGWAALAAGAALFACLVAVSAVASFGVELLLRDRRRAETAALVLSVGLIAASLVPALLNRPEKHTGGGPDTAQEHRTEVEEPARQTGPAEGRSSVPRVGRAVGSDEEEGATDASDRAAEEALEDLSVPPLWTVAVPSEGYARVLSAVADGRAGAAWAGAGLLGAEALLLFGLSYPLWRRLGTGVAESGGRRGGAAEASIPRPPGVAPAVAGIAWIQVRTALRTLPGRLALITPPVMVVFLTMLAGGDWAPNVARGVVPVAGVLLTLAGCGMGLMSLQPISVNQFAVDGSGLLVELQGPVSDRELVSGKALGIGVLSAMTMLPATVVVVVVRPETLALWPAVLLIGASAVLLTAPVNALLSAAFPKAVDPGKFGKESQPHQLAGFLAVLATALAFGPGVLAAAVTLIGTRSPLAATAATLAWVAVSFVLCRIGLRLAAGMLAARRESLYL